MHGRQGQRQGQWGGRAECPGRMPCPAGQQQPATCRQPAIGSGPGGMRRGAPTWQVTLFSTPMTLLPMDGVLAAPTSASASCGQSQWMVRCRGGRWALGSIKWRSEPHIRRALLRAGRHAGDSLRLCPRTTQRLRYSTVTWGSSGYTSFSRAASLSGKNCPSTPPPDSSAPARSALSLLRGRAGAGQGRAGSGVTRG